MSDTSVLGRMFHPNRIKIEEHHNRYKVVLQEPQAPDSRIEIHNIPDDAIIIDLDGSFANDSLFKGNQGECKRADYLIFSEQRQRIIFIEMKKSASSRKDIIKQLKGSLCVFEYLQVIAREFFHESDFLANYEQCFISITHTGTQTRKTEIEKTTAIHNRPELMLNLSWARTIQFNLLVA